MRVACEWHNNMIDLFIKGLTSDSRRVQPGDVFVALIGAREDGQNYISDAIKRGAVAVLSEASNQTAHRTSKLKKNIIAYSGLTEAIGFMASRFFSEPSHSLPVIGITGTNGKTSCAHFIAQLFNAWSKPCGLMGTLGVGFLSHLETIGCTTPDAITVQQYLATFRDQKAFAVAMEVSSHALTQGRVNGVRFNTAIFTNFTRDHLDYHENMDNYWKAKKQLWTKHEVKHAVINLEDPKAQDLVKTLLQEKRVSKSNIIGYTTSDVSFMSREALKGIMLIKTPSLYLDATGMSVTVQTPWGKGQFCSSLLGHFNLSNLLAALAAVCIQGMPFERALSAIEHVSTVPGRMMCLGGNNQPLVVVDYAHTPDALKQVLMALRSHCQAKLWCIFGCGGDRDRGKRPLMAHIAEALSDRIIFTLDNPRTEVQAQIFDDMLKGLKNIDAVMIEPDRVTAIMLAILQAGPADIILIAGKGHETMQIIGTKSEPMDDYQEAKKALESRTS